MQLFEFEEQYYLLQTTYCNRWVRQVVHATITVFSVQRSSYTNFSTINIGTDYVADFFMSGERKLSPIIEHARKYSNIQQVRLPRIPRDYWKWYSRHPGVFRYPI